MGKDARYELGLLRPETTIDPASAEAIVKVATAHPLAQEVRFDPAGFKDALSALSLGRAVGLGKDARYELGLLRPETVIDPASAEAIVKAATAHPLAQEVRFDPTGFKDAISALRGMEQDRTGKKPEPEQEPEGSEQEQEESEG